MINYSIAIDSRERIPWCFNHELYDMFKMKLDTGDYSIIGYEDKITIDRKQSTMELAINLTGKDYIRFQKELVRMQSFEEAYFVLEFSIQDLLIYPEGTNIKYKDKIKRKGPALLKQIQTIEDRYGVKFIFAGDRFEAQKITLEIFDNFMRKHGH